MWSYMVFLSFAVAAPDISAVVSVIILTSLTSPASKFDVICDTRFATVLLSFLILGILYLMH